MSLIGLGQQLNNATQTFAVFCTIARQRQLSMSRWMAAFDARS
jgi:hypothetical protein